MFFKDIYGLITVRQERDQFGNLVNVYFNGDYASSRGFEASITKSFSHKFSAEANYTYSLATGVASDPNSALQFFNGGKLYLPIAEQPLDWDQRHTFSLQANVRDPGKWGFRMLWTYGSGFPFTPSFRNDRRPDPMLDNSRRLPSVSRLTIDGDKFYKVWGQNVTLFFDARNVLNAKNIQNLAANGNRLPESVHQYRGQRLPDLLHGDRSSGRRVPAGHQWRQRSGLGAGQRSARVRRRSQRTSGLERHVLGWLRDSQGGSGGNDRLDRWSIAVGPWPCWPRCSSRRRMPRSRPERPTRTV